jgi:hypothetical protein
MVIASGKFARENNLKPIFRILGYGDAARDPVGIDSLSMSVS